MNITPRLLTVKTISLIHTTDSADTHIMELRFCPLSSLSLSETQTNCPNSKTRAYLNKFGIKLFIQWEALDYALITGMESPQLYPLVGGISANRAREKLAENVRLR